MTDEKAVVAHYKSVSLIRLWEHKSTSDSRFYGENRPGFLPNMGLAYAFLVYCILCIFGLTAMEIRCADYATPSTRKVWH
jgi:hypothetical protein